MRNGPRFVVSDQAALLSSSKPGDGGWESLDVDGLTRLRVEILAKTE